MKNTIYLILGLFIASCGGNLDKAEKQDLSAQDEGAIHEGQAVDQSKYTIESYLIKGSEIATQTQKELLRAVQGAMAEGGPAYAVDYCNLEALAIKDSLSELNNCTIQRLSFKYRNPADKPATDLEKQQLKSFERLHGEGETLNPQVYFVEDRVEYYQPIFIGSGTCLLCHGDPGTQIAGETLGTIRALYPNDRATGYALNDFRGVWKITFLDR